MYKDSRKVYRIDDACGEVTWVVARSKKKATAIYEESIGEDADIESIGIVAPSIHMKINSEDEGKQRTKTARMWAKTTPVGPLCSTYW